MAASSLPPTDAELFEALEGWFANARSMIVEPLGNGNINWTYLVRGACGNFVLQRINRTVFPDPERLIENFHKIQTHIFRHHRDCDTGFLCPTLRECLDGGFFFRSSSRQYWRVMDYIPHVMPTHLHGTELAAGLGQVLGRFHRLTQDLDPQELCDPLPGFHVAPGYVQAFDIALGKTDRAESEALLWCVSFVEKHRHLLGVLEKAASLGHLQRRVIHGDPKQDNIIYTVDGMACGLFDFDTAGPGLLHYDLGDCLRSIGNRAGEMAEDLDQVFFSVPYFAAFWQRYCAVMADMLSSSDVEYLFDSICCLTMELGVRFLTDYLEGDIYFKTSSSTQNLWRAMVQFHLVCSVLQQEKEIRFLAHKDFSFNFSSK